ncbi:hypothetical protein FOA43_000706 [Brettanomyces nanus]|uniref:Topoisomerase I damage affected protein 11 n=1 Tax=Eeniella nana TaxID=13502 RepID=A0A875RWT6_EENNA|nr:uncharacterized protein FOA43_000706 [Brettanomyces nanus]QPG73396.1 hypothetical protein FOA43_000706 [Brettanomyces nanus]
MSDIIDGPGTSEHRTSTSTSPDVQAFTPKHMKNISTSSISTSGKKTGINLGFSVIGNTPTLVGSPSGRSDGKSPLINHSPTFQESKLNSPRRSITQERPPSPIKKKADLVESRSQGLSDRFRLLASKEMEILEIKNAIKELDNRKSMLEFEIKDLKVNLERELIRNVARQHDEDKPNTVTLAPKTARTRSKIEMHTPNQVNDLTARHTSHAGISTTGEHNGQSWISRPISFLQQFDSLISQEFDKLQISDPVREKLRLAQEDRYRKDHQSRRLRSPKDLSKKEISSPLKSLADDSTPSDIMQSVSQHLWSFVNDVKSNLLVDESLVQSQVVKRNITPSLVSLKEVPVSHDDSDRDSGSEVNDSDLWDNDDLLDL